MSIVPRGVREITATITIKSFVLNIGKAEVLVTEEGFVRVNGALVPLTRYERAFMLALAQGCGQIRTPRMMMALMWPDSKKPVLKLLDVYASKLRARLGKAHPDARPAVRSVWGRGYAFGEPTQAAVTAPADLPQHDSDIHWTVARKELLIEAVRSGKVASKDIFRYYPDLSPKEFAEWCNIYDHYGPPGLRSTRSDLFEIAA